MNQGKLDHSSNLATGTENTNEIVAEVIAIGDEISSGQRLDTNSQWISRQLGDLGVRVAYHSSVGDELEEMIGVFSSAIQRANIVVCTGGLGPTADDLTRQTIASAAGVELELHQNIVEHIRAIYEAHGREMPESNRTQAYFPEGAVIIDNPEGTAPGIELAVKRQTGTCTLFALPGVPYELKQMWPHVESAVNKITGRTLTTHHHTIHCFGGGESQIEQMLPDMIARDRLPRVGITASKATISLRIVGVAETQADCIAQIQPTIKTINDTLGSLVFGENGIELHEVVLNLLKEKSLTLSIVDFGFGGLAAEKLFSIDHTGSQSKSSLHGSLAIGKSQMNSWCCEPSHSTTEVLQMSADRIREQFAADIGIAIGPPEKDPQLPKPKNAREPTRTYQVAIATSEDTQLQTFKYGGHSGLRADRTAKQILNAIRLHLMGVES